MNKNKYLIYLRKSRTDKDFVENSEELTLSRHKKILSELADQQKYNVTYIFEEVVSGDSIAARPKMQELLSCVESGDYEGVLVMDLERLGRGNSIDQGIIQQTFKFSDTKIITPQKIYDFNNEFDEEYAEFGLFMGRKEYKMTKRRLLNGRLASINEGKYCGGTAPFGYETYKLKGEKGYSLKIIPTQASVVRLIFDWYINGIDNKSVGCFVIARKLNELGYTNQNNTPWTQGHIVKIINNLTYTGKIVWYNKKQHTKIENGVISNYVATMPSNERIIVDGLHEAIIDEEIFNKAMSRKGKQIPRSNRYKELQNPFVGILYCNKCGKKMMLRSADRWGKRAYCCPNVNCDNKGVYLDTFENKFLTAIKGIYENYIVSSEFKNISTNNINIDALQTNKLELYNSFIQSNDQLDKAYDFLEQGIYDTPTFIKRSETLKTKIADIEFSLQAIETEISNIESLKSEKDTFIPILRTLAESYYSLTNAQEKNNLIKEVIERIDYEKFGSGRGHSDEFTLALSVKYPF